ncbi:MAG: glycoside hydrolase family 88 protein [Bacteroidales bacterium]|nr:glycoside hydrolase family 88 protein [Bacteroidales bacterium]
MEKVAEWQLMHPSGKELWAWEYGAFYAGLMAYYHIAPQKKYLDSMLLMGKKNNWELKPHPYLADNFAIAQTYIDLYGITGNSEIIDKTRYVMDMAFYRKPAEPDLRWEGNPYKLHWWSWCDALFMAPPAFSKMSKVTGDDKYLYEMDRLWLLTYNYLYDHEENLFYRDDSYFNARTKKNKKVFWSRGNGWVLGGLVRILESMSGDFPNRSFYENLFVEMCNRLIEIQSPEGYWYSSLLDKEEYNVKETSGTGFYCYAFAWGINNHLLNREKYYPSVVKAWKTLVEAVQPDGKLGYVQLVGVGPGQVHQEDTETYGTGAFLLAGSELYKLSDY